MIHPTITKYAAEDGIKDETLRKWKRRGLPWRKRLEYRERARKRGDVLPLKALDCDRFAPVSY